MLVGALLIRFSKPLGCGHRMYCTQLALCLEIVSIIHTVSWYGPFPLSSLSPSKVDQHDSIIAEDLRVFRARESRLRRSTQNAPLAEDVVQELSPLEIRVFFCFGI